MRGLVCLVTGATSGIGRATALDLARRGATVVLAARDPARAESVRAEIHAETGNPDIAIVPLDLASLASVRTAAVDVQRRFAALHVLINNAGMHATRRLETIDGFERTIAVNHLGPFLLTTLLLPRLRSSASSRIITISSWFERFGRISFDDLDGARRFSPFRAYFQSKLANLLFTFELARRLDGSGVTANAMHPGLVATRLLRGFPAPLRRSYEWLLLTPEQGARTVVRLASAPDVAGLSGRYFGPGGREATPSRRARDPAVAARLWELSERLTGAPVAAPD
ncbi:MAG TPA: SDR family oxidoreductase [Gemmatimonadaceae bacterium]|nr:SDR family oxidoreductase [Gemmatimonadaceae bacterium]